MSEDHKKRVQKAVENFSNSMLKKQSPKRKNKKPERDVQCACIAWMRDSGWDVQVYEAKATYDPRRGVWRNQAMPAGTCDCMGLDAIGAAVFVEFKSPGRRSTFNDPKNYRQKRFLVEKLHRGAFAVVIDSVDELIRIYNFWLTLMNREDKIKFLLEQLP